MIFKNRYNKVYCFFEIIIKIFFLVIIDIDFFMFFIDPQMFVDMSSGFYFIIHMILTIFIIYNICLCIKPIVVLEDDCLIVYSINNIKVKQKILISEVLYVTTSKKRRQFDSNAIVLELVLEKRNVLFGLDKQDYIAFQNLTQGTVLCLDEK